MTQISLQVEGVDRMERDISILKRGFDAPIRPVATQLAEMTYVDVRAQINSAGARGPHGAYPKNKQSTIDRYTAMNRRGFAVLNQPMRATDTLFKAETTRGAPHGILIVEDKALTQGTDLVYALIHQNKGRMQYDPTDTDIARRLSIIKRGIVKEANHFFDYVDTGEFAF